MQRTAPLPTSGPEPVPSPVPGGWAFPRWDDPRWVFAGLLGTYALLGCTWLGFNRNPLQIALIVLVGCTLDMALAWFVKREKVVPLSALISCLSLSLILNFSHDYFLLFFPVLLTIASKYLITFKGKHFFNPSLFGVAVSLLVANEWITAAPAYQWGGSLAMTTVLSMAALSFFIFKVGRLPLVASFLVFYALQTAVRAFIMRHHLPPETLFLGTMTTAPFFLFTFYMITDPATSPKTPKGQIAFAFVLTLVDLYLHKMESVFTFFYAAFGIACTRFVFMHARELWRTRGEHLKSALSPLRLRAVGAVTAIAVLATGTYGFAIHPSVKAAPLSFGFERIPPERSGIVTQMGDIFHQVDPRMAHVAKWVLSVGDAVAVGDYDADGRLDLFLTNALKRPEDRNALYRNMGDFRFERVAMPALAADPDPGKHGLAAAAAFADYDADGDSDLFVSYGYGPSRLFRNTLAETGKPGFSDVTAVAGISGHTISLTANWFDYDRDGRLDLLVGNAVTPYLPGYEQPTPLNVFKLPEPQHPGDRRMFNFMHNGWHNADNGGVNVLYRNLGNGRFAKMPIEKMGMPETHWTIAIGTADLNRDGWTDLYCATDFGRDDLYLNRNGERFERVQGPMFGDVGLDTYKGMNSTLDDFDRNGYMDIYISNVHHALQAEGSLLWMTRPGADPFVPSFSDEATKRGALNENRFGWGAAAGDVNNDGWRDLVQANGMVDDRLDPMAEPPSGIWGLFDHKDYWYVNHKLMQSGPEIHTFADKWGDLRGRTIYPNEARRLYLNLGDRDRLQFVDVAEEAGIADPDNSRGAALVDLDDDGDLDLVVTNQHGPVSLYRNTLMERRATGAGWLGLSLEGDDRSTARTPVGTRVEVSYQEAGKRVTQVQEVQVVNGFAAQKDPRLHFGLGAWKGPVDVMVRWHGSGRTTTHRLEAGRYHTLKLGEVQSSR